MSLPAKREGWRRKYDVSGMLTARLHRAASELDPMMTLSPSSTHFSSLTLTNQQRWLGEDFCRRHDGEEQRTVLKL
jgi:hypothetical protein